MSSDISRGEIQVEGRLVDASNATLFGFVKSPDQDQASNEGIAVIYKPISGERPLWDFSDGNLASREVAAFLISELLSYHIVPTTILRDGPYGEGAVQRWVEIDESIDPVELGQSEHPEIRKMALFDAIINNTDRKFGHILATSDGEVFGCDHGVTFHTENKLRTVLWQWAGAPLTNSEIADLSRLKGNLSGIDLEKYLTRSEIFALNERIDRLISTNVFPQPSPEWPAIPWPPF